MKKAGYLNAAADGGQTKARPSVSADKDMTRMLRVQAHRRDIQHAVSWTIKQNLRGRLRHLGIIITAHQQGAPDKASCFP